MGNEYFNFAYRSHGLVIDCQCDYQSGMSLISAHHKGEEIIGILSESEKSRITCAALEEANKNKWKLIPIR